MPQNNAPFRRSLWPALRTRLANNNPWDGFEGRSDVGMVQCAPGKHHWGDENDRHDRQGCHSRSGMRRRRVWHFHTSHNGQWRAWKREEKKKKTPRTSVRLSRLTLLQVPLVVPRLLVLSDELLHPAGAKHQSGVNFLSLPRRRCDPLRREAPPEVTTSGGGGGSGDAVTLSGNLVTEAPASRSRWQRIQPEPQRQGESWIAIIVIIIGFLEREKEVGRKI